MKVRGVKVKRREGQRREGQSGDSETAVGQNSGRAQLGHGSKWLLGQSGNWVKVVTGSNLTWDKVTMAQLQVEFQRRIWEFSRAGVQQRKSAIFNFK